MTITNNKKIGNVRLSFCENAGASLTKIQYPQSVTPVEMGSNYYDVQSSDDVLMFVLGSRGTSCEQATFMWNPTPSSSG